MHCFFLFCFKRKQEKNSAARRPNTKNSNTLWIYISIVVMFTLFSLRTIPLFLLLYILCVYLCVTSSSIVLFSNTQHDAHARASSVPFYTGTKNTEATAFFPQCSGEGENNSALLQLVISSNVALLVAVYVCECVMRKKKK